VSSHLLTAQPGRFARTCTIAQSLFLLHPVRLHLILLTCGNVQRIDSFLGKNTAKMRSHGRGTSSLLHIQAWSKPQINTVIQTPFPLLDQDTKGEVPTNTCSPFQIPLSTLLTLNEPTKSEPHKTQVSSKHCDFWVEFPPIQHQQGCWWLNIFTGFKTPSSTPAAGSISTLTGI